MNKPIDREWIVRCLTQEWTGFDHVDAMMLLAVAKALVEWREKLEDMTENKLVVCNVLDQIKRGIGPKGEGK